MALSPHFDLSSLNTRFRHLSQCTTKSDFSDVLEFRTSRQRKNGYIPNLASNYPPIHRYSVSLTANNMYERAIIERIWSKHPVKYRKFKIFL